MADTDTTYEARSRTMYDEKALEHAFFLAKYAAWKAEMMAHLADHEAAAARKWPATTMDCTSVGGSRCQYIDRQIAHWQRRLAGAAE